MMIWKLFGVLVALGGLLALAWPLLAGALFPSVQRGMSFLRRKPLEACVLLAAIAGFVVHGATKHYIIDKINYKGVYDGEPHTAYAGASIGNGIWVLDSAYYSESPDGPFTSIDPPQYVNAGHYTIYCSIYNDEDERIPTTCTVDIEPKKLTEAMVGAIPDQAYTGGVVKPVVSVADGDLLTTNDYEVVYRGNTGPGLGGLVVVATNNYTGKIYRSFNICAPYGGQVVEPRTVVAGRTATWTAKADAGSVFAGWSGSAVAALGLSDNELKNPKLTLKVPQGFTADDLVAEFIPFEKDGLSRLGFDRTDFVRGEAATAVLTHDSRSLVTAKVSGLPPGLSFDAKTLRMTGVPKTIGNYAVTVTAHNASGYAWAETVLMRVLDPAAGNPSEGAGNLPAPARKAYAALTLLHDAGQGTVSGGGVYPVGQKVKIVAKPAKGMAFLGWYQMSGHAVTNAVGDYRSSSLMVELMGPQYILAKFLPVEEAVATLQASVGGQTLDRPVAVSVPAGVQRKIPLAVEACVATKVTVTGLPTGLRYDATQGAIVGAATQATTAPRKVSVKVALAGQSYSYSFTLAVEPLPAWVQGASFYGSGAVDGEIGQATLTVAASGKVSGKIAMVGGRVWTLAAENFAALENGRVYCARILVRNGRESRVGNLSLWAEDFGEGRLIGRFEVEPDPDLTDVTVEGWQSAYLRKDLADAVEPSQGREWTIETEQGTLTFQGRAKGALSVRGVLDGVTTSAGSQLVCTGLNALGEPSYRATVRFAARGKFKGLLWSGILNPVEEGEVEDYPPNVVTTTLDVVDPNDGVTSLREAFAAGNEIKFALPKGSQTVCTLRQSLYFETGKIIDGAILSSEKGQIVTNRVTISGGGAVRLFRGAYGTASIAFRNLILEEGYVNPGGYAPETCGSVVLATSWGTVTFDNCLVRNCYAEGNGGTVDWYGPVSMRNSTFENNRADHMGGVLCLNSGGVTAEDCSFTNNYGGTSSGVFRVDGNSLFRGCTFVGNTGYNGAVVFGKGSYTFEQCVFTGNKARSRGDMICTYTYLLPGATLPERSVTFIGCTLQGTDSQSISLQSDYSLTISQ